MNARNKKLLITLTFIMWNAASIAAIGQVWDCTWQFDFNSNPSASGIWAYKHYVNGGLLSYKRSGNLYWGQYGWSLTSGAWDPSAVFCWYPAYPQGGAYLESSQDFGGHGPWQVEWTSPVDGWVKIDGCMYVSIWAGTTSYRVVHWELNHNGQTFTEGYVRYNQATGVVLTGRANAVYFDADGSCGPWAVYRKVRQGDTIGLISEGSTINPQDPWATFVGAKFRIEQVAEPDYILPQIEGDLNGDCHVDLQDLAKFARVWLESGCDSPEDCLGCDFDQSGTIDIDDQGVIANNWCQDAAWYRNLGYVLVGPNGPLDGSDFGPSTPGTQTSGIQEALDFAHDNARDVYIAGSEMGLGQSGGAVYYLDETLYVPWGHNWKLDGGEYRLVYTPADGNPAVVIDSQQNSTLKFGVIEGGHSLNQPIVQIKPSLPGPREDIVCAANTFTFGGLIGSGGVEPADVSQSTGVGLLLDGSDAAGGIQNNKFYIGRTMWCSLGVYLKEKVTGNLFEPYQIRASDTGIQTGNSTTSESIQANIFTIAISDTNTGLRIYGNRDLFIGNILGGLAGQGIIFEANAYENLVFNGSLMQGFTNNSASPTNRVIMSTPAGYDVTTPAFPVSGVDIRNGHPYPVEVQIVTAGQVSQWTVTDAQQGTSQNFAAGLAVGQRFRLDIGCQVRFSYTQSPTWRWMRSQ